MTSEISRKHTPNVDSYKSYNIKFCLLKSYVSYYPSEKWVIFSLVISVVGTISETQQ